MALTRFDIVSIIVILALTFICFYRHLKVRHTTAGDNTSLGVINLVEKVKSELMTLESARLKKNEPALFQLKDFDLEIKFTVNEKTKESGGVEYQVVTISSEREVSNEKVQTIKLHMVAAEPEKGESLPSSPASPKTTIPVN